MALNNSGKISLAGSTVGESIAAELGLGATTQISLNDTVVRALAGISSGMIQLDDFYGKSAGSASYIAYFDNVNSLAVTGNQYFPSLIWVESDNCYYASFTSWVSSSSNIFGTLFVKFDSNFNILLTNYLRSPYTNWTATQSEFSARLQKLPDGTIMTFGSFRNSSVGSASHRHTPQVSKLDSNLNIYNPKQFYSSTLNVNFNMRAQPPIILNGYVVSAVIGAASQSAGHGGDCYLNMTSLAIAGSTPYTTRRYYPVKRKDGVNGYYITAGSASTYEIKKLDSNLNEIYSRRISPAYVQTGEDVIATALDGSVYTQYHKSTGIQYITKFDADLNHVWTKSFPASVASINNKCATDKDSNAYFLYAGTLNGSPTGKYHIFKFDPNGNLLWQRTIGINAADLSNVIFNYQTQGSIQIDYHGYLDTKLNLIHSFESKKHRMLSLDLDNPEIGVYAINGSNYEIAASSIVFTNEAAPAITADSTTPLANSFPPNTFTNLPTSFAAPTTLYNGKVDI